MYRDVYVYIHTYIYIYISVLWSISYSATCYALASHVCRQQASHASLAGLYSRPEFRCVSMRCSSRWCLVFVEQPMVPGVCKTADGIALHPPLTAARGPSVSVYSFSTRIKNKFSFWGGNISTRRVVVEFRWGAQITQTLPYKEYWKYMGWRKRE